MVIVHRIGAVGRLDFQQVHQQAGALDVAQKARAQPVAGVGAFDQTGDVRDHKPALAGQLGDAEVRFKRGERVVRHARAGVTDLAQQCALTGIGLADQAHVGDELQFQAQIPLLAGLAVGELPRRLVRGRLEVLVAEAAAPAAGDEHALVQPIHVGQQLAGVGVVDQRARRDPDFQVGPGLAAALAARAGLAGLGVPVVAAGEVQQRVHAGCGDEIHAAAVAAVAAVGPALGNVLFTTEADGPIAAAAAAHEDRRLIDQHRQPPPRVSQARPRDRRAERKRAPKRTPASHRIESNCAAFGSV